MGYSTYFEGKFNFNKPLSFEDNLFLYKLANSRRMARNVDAKYGVDGEFYVDGGGFKGQAQEKNIIDYNRAPRTQPNLWCQWVPDDGGKTLVHDGCEKFHDYVDWLKYIIEWIKPRGYVLNGTVEWRGEEIDDHGKILVVDNVVRTQRGRWVWTDSDNQFDSEEVDYIG